MNLNNVFSRTLMSSLAAGFLVFFITIPIASIIISRGNLDEFGAYVFLIALVMYVVYWPIQIALSVMHLILTRYWARTQPPSDAGIIQAFLITEWLLYMMIYLFLVWAFYDPLAWQGIFIFSIPYIISCTVSVFFYRKNYSFHLQSLVSTTTTID